MLNSIIKQVKTAFLLLVLLSMITGLIYPALVTGLAQLFFPWQANGSFISQGQTYSGSLLIGQAFSDPKYFWGRPSATTPFPYNSQSSSGSNLGPSNPDLLNTVKSRIRVLQQVDQDNKKLIPIDLVTASASGLDPEISPLAAFYQVSRIAKIRGISAAKIETLVKNSILHRTFGILGEPRINVLQLNFALDQLTSAEGRKNERAAPKA